MFKKYLANRRIRKFLTITTRTLVMDYGKSNEYTEGQVKTVLKKLGYCGELEAIAIAIFCNEEIAKNLGLDEALIKKYRGYPARHDTGYGYYGSSGSHGGGGADSGGGGGSD